MKCGRQVDLPSVCPENHWSWVNRVLCTSCQSMLRRNSFYFVLTFLSIPPTSLKFCRLRDNKLWLQCRINLPMYHSLTTTCTTLNRCGGRRFNNHFSKFQESDEGSLSDLQEADRQLGLARTLSPPFMKSIDRQNSFQTHGSFQKVCKDLPPNKKAISAALEVHWLDCLQRRYIWDFYRSFQFIASTIFRCHSGLYSRQK